MDDFKLVGTTENLKAGRELIADSGLVLDSPAPLGDYLGCGQFSVHVSASEAQRRLDHARPFLKDIYGQNEVKAGKLVRAIRHNMFGFFRQCVEFYSEWAKVDPSKLKQVATPGLDDHQLKPETSKLKAFSPKMLQKSS